MEFSVDLGLPPLRVVMPHRWPCLRVPHHPVLADVELESGHDLVDVRDPLVDTSHLLCHVPISGEAGVTVLGGVQQCAEGHHTGWVVLSSYMLVWACTDILSS